MRHIWHRHGPSEDLLQIMSNKIDLAEHDRHEEARFSKLSKPMQLRSAEYLQMHVMDNVRQRIEAGHKDFVDEIRVCTVLFIGFPFLKVP